jgi:hypothetical protein
MLAGCLVRFIALLIFSGSCLLWQCAGSFLSRLLVFGFLATANMIVVATYK